MRELVLFARAWQLPVATVAWSLVAQALLEARRGGRNGAEPRRELERLAALALRGRCSRCAGREDDEHADG